MMNLVVSSRRVMHFIDLIMSSLESPRRQPAATQHMALRWPCWGAAALRRLVRFRQAVGATSKLNSDDALAGMRPG